jgi:hypothetical protein
MLGLPRSLTGVSLRAFRPAGNPIQPGRQSRVEQSHTAPITITTFNQEGIMRESGGAAS